MIKSLLSIEKVQKIREAAGNVLPIGHSFIPFDIVIATYCGDIDGSDLTVKSLFASLPYSTMGIRYHFKKLLADGWIELHNGDKDTRVKRVRVTNKLLVQLQLFDREIEKYLLKV